MAFVKPIREKGIIISKTYCEKKDARVDQTGKEWPARPERFVVEVISCDEDDFDKVKGILNGTRAEYEVDKATFEKVKFGDWANVKYEVTQYGEKLSIKPLKFELIEK